MSNVGIFSPMFVNGTIETSVYDVSRLQELYPSWDNFSKSEKYEILSTTTPDESYDFTNVTTEELHKYFVRNLNNEDTSASANVAASVFAVGDGGENGTAVTDTDLNNRQFSQSVTDSTSNGDDLLVSTLLGANDANGVDIDEVGLFSGDPANRANTDVFLINHANFSSITKSDSKTITFDITLSFSDV